jgi:DNA (cytosine-5)-methyltransferase 1
MKKAFQFRIYPNKNQEVAMPKKRLSVADFFCGAGGFSEGFQQNGFDVVFALDNWQPAVDTHLLNHPDCKTLKMDILELDTPEKIDLYVPDVDVIIGSPPCVSFSGSNNSGKADKSHGIRLIKAYLRIIAWKKKKGVLKYWLLENVPNSAKYIKEVYTWEELDIPGDGPKLTMQQRNIINAEDYCVPQKRKRFICGDYPLPEPTCKEKANRKTVRMVLDSLGNPFKNVTERYVKDPNYGFSILSSMLTDHFYDTIVTNSEWKSAKRQKEDHGFMGKMSFPENIDRPSRTVMATRSGYTRESMIFDAYNENDEHIGYRLPTIREIASFMSFPITYQFEAISEGLKYQLVGNSVCPILSASIAKEILKTMDINAPKEFNPPQDIRPSFNLNGKKREKMVLKPKKFNAKFAMHIPYIKLNGFRVELNNVESDFKRGIIKWACVLHQGIGKRALKCGPEECKIYKITKKIPGFESFKMDVMKSFDKIDLTHINLQEAYIDGCNSEFISPVRALDIMRELIDKHYPDEKEKIENFDRKIAINRDYVPIRIIAGLYACDYFTNRLK